MPSKKTIIIILAIFILLMGIFSLRLVIGGPEDDWICVNNEWIKHGKPNALKPSEGCGDEKLIGGDKDEQGCLIAAGYGWCPSTGKCQRMWEEYCEEYKDQFRGGEDQAKEITNFAECAAAGNPVMESYPRQCRLGSETFIEDIGNTVEKNDLIILDSPRPNEEIASPLIVSGQARGYWFFEGSFPVILTNWDGLIIADGIATAQDEWMTEDFVPFKASLDFTADTGVSNRGSLILKKDNPSGLPENDDALEIPVFFK